MITTEFSRIAVQRLRQVRGWCVILLMVVSLLGGARAANRVSEESSPEESSEVLEYAHRLAEGSQRSPGRRLKARPTRVSSESHSARTPARFQADRAGPGSVTSDGHALPNGLCAPQRC